MQLVFKFGSFVPEGKKDAIGYWEVTAVGPDGSQERLAARVDGTHIRSWWWGAPLREISQYLTQYGNDGWSLIAENVGDGNNGSWETYRYVLSRPDASSDSSIPRSFRHDR